MVFGALSVLGLLIILIPLPTYPEFVVREIKACCHHQISLKCDFRPAKLAIIQARYLLSTSVESASRHRGESPLTEFIALSDMDIKFVHDLLHEGRIDTLVDLNSPDWMKKYGARKNFYKNTRRYTTPNPIPSGSKFFPNRSIELPVYEKNFLDKDTIWNQNLLHQLDSERWIRSNESESGLVNNFPCLSYEALSSGVNRTGENSRRPRWEYKDLRPFFNRRCSGRSECIVNLLRNKQRDEDITRVCHKWPDGRISIKYVCLDSSSGDVHSNCNEDVSPAQEGFILNPGYPDLYPGDRPCQWRLQVEEQRLLLVFLDISLREKEKSKCRDELSVSEDRAKLLSLCGDQESAIAVLSPGDRLNVTFNVESRLAFPKRGFLLYFRVIGCENPGAQLNSYLVSRNASHAYFHCEVGYFLPKTLTQTRLLTCHPVNRTWSSTQPECSSGRGFFSQDASPTIWPVINRASKESVIFDYVIPSLVLITILVSNLCLLMWIRRKIIRRKTEMDKEDEDEEREEILGTCTPEGTEESTFTLSSDGGMEGMNMKPGGRPWDFLEFADLEEKVGFMTGERSSVVPKSNGKVYHMHNGNGALPSRYTSSPNHNENGNPSPYRFPRTTQV